MHLRVILILLAIAGSHSDSVSQVFPADRWDVRLMPNGFARETSYLAVDPDGRPYISGTASINGELTNNFAYLEDGHWVAQEPIGGQGPRTLQFFGDTTLAIGSFKIDSNWVRVMIRVRDAKGVQGAWQPLIPSFVDIASSLYHDGSLLFFGNFDSIGGVAAPSIALWQNGRFHAITTRFEGMEQIPDNWRVSDAVVLRDTLVIIVNNERIYRKRFDDTSAFRPIEGFSGTIDDLGVFDDELIASGRMRSTTDATANAVLRFNGTEWLRIGTLKDVLLGEGGGQLLVHGRYLYVLGRITKAGKYPVNSLVRWDGHEWDTSVDRAYVSSIATNGKELFAIEDGVRSRLMRMIGDSWQYVDNGHYTGGPSDGNTTIHDLVATDEGVWASGYFTVFTRSGDTVRNIGLWTGDDWIPVKLKGAGAFGHQLAHDNNRVYYACYEGKIAWMFDLTSNDSLPIDSVRAQDFQYSDNFGGMDVTVRGDTVYYGFKSHGRTSHTFGNGTVLSPSSYDEEVAFFRPTPDDVWSARGDDLFQYTTAMRIQLPTEPKSMLSLGDSFLVGTSTASSGSTAFGVIGPDKKFSPVYGTATEYTSINALQDYKGMLFFAGNLSVMKLVSLENIGCFPTGDAHSTNVLDVGKGVDGPVNAMCVWNDKLFVGGRFSRMGELPANGFAAYDLRGVSRVARSKPKSDGIVIYPQPASSTIAVSSNKDLMTGSFTIKDARGVTVLQGRLTSGSVIDIRRLSAGVYWLEMEAGIARARFIKIE